MHKGNALLNGVYNPPSPYKSKQTWGDRHKRKLSRFSFRNKGTSELLEVGSKTRTGPLVPPCFLEVPKRNKKQPSNQNQTYKSHHPLRWDICWCNCLDSIHTHTWVVSLSLSLTLTHTDTHKSREHKIRHWLTCFSFLLLLLFVVVFVATVVL